MPLFRRRTLAPAVVLVALALLTVSADARPQDFRLTDPIAESRTREDLLDFCVANPGNCAISVSAIDEGWERHLNPDRPQVLASTFKTLMLMAYGQAVVDGALDPADTMSKEQWARYLTLDGGALAASWEQLGQPDQVSWNDLARAMIRNSDNSTPDHLIGELGTKRLKKARKLFRGFHDMPAAISAMFGLWFNANGIGGTGTRVADEYGSLGANGYRRELDGFRKGLSANGAVETNRRSLCVRPPWEGGGACDPVTPATSNNDLLQMFQTHFVRSTTRTYADLMSRMVQGTLLPAAVDDVVRPILEIWLEIFPTLSPAFSRYGLKGGSLATSAGNDIITWAHYMQAGSNRYVVVVFLQGLTSFGRPPTADDLNAFAQGFALDAGFRQTVADALDDDDLRPEVVGQILKAKGKSKLTVRARVENTGPNATTPIVVRLYASDDNRLDAGDTLIGTANIGSLKGRKGKNFTLKGKVDGGASGKYALLSVDDDNDLTEQDEGNNLIWERVR